MSRTTLDIDSRVLAAARSRVRAGKARSIGEAVSSLALEGIANQRTAPTSGNTRNGILLMPVAGDALITDEMVAEAMLDE